MSRLSRALSLLAALAVALAASSPAVAAGAAPRAGGLSISIILPVNGSVIKGDVSLVGNASGPEGKSLKVGISFNGVKWLPAEGNTSWSWFWSTYAFKDGTYTVTARVDGGGDWAEASATYTVRNTMPPFVLQDIYPPWDELHLKAGDAADFSVALNTTYIGSVLYNWTLDGAVVESGGADWYNFTARASELGNHTLRVDVLAEGVVQASRSWNMSVRALALPPVIKGSGPAERNISVYLGDTVRFNVTAADPQGKGLTYRWRFDLAPAPGNVTGGKIDLLFNTTGTHVVEVEVSNGETNATVRWNVTVGEAPSIGLIDIMPCLVYIVMGLFLGIWYGRRTSVQGRTSG